MIQDSACGFMSVESLTAVNTGQGNGHHNACPLTHRRTLTGGESGRIGIFMMQIFLDRKFEW